jgi:tripartite-type tricarboxylate transporter receptor subunit TctC
MKMKKERSSFAWSSIPLFVGSAAGASRNGAIFTRKILCKLIVIIAFLILSLHAAFLSMNAIAGEIGYPNRPITIVNQFTAGGGGDLALKALAREMQIFLGHPVLVESKPGASGIVAGDYVARARPDGYVIGGFSSTACDPELYTQFRKASYSSTDLIPIVRYLAYSYCLFSKKDAPWSSLNDFFKYVHENPNKVRWGHPGVGHQYHILGVALSKTNNLEMIPVPFKGASDILIAVLGGHIEIGIGAVAAVKSQVDSGKAIILAIQHSERVSYMPNVPTFKELGCDLGLAPYYMGLFAPKGTPDEVIRKIHDSVKKAVETQQLKDAANSIGFDLYYGTANDLINDMKNDRNTIGNLLKEILKQEK